MSKPKNVKIVKHSKSEMPENSELVAKEPKPRKSRAKKIPTKEESLKMLQDTSKELEQIVADLKDDQMRLQGLSLKKVPELINEAISNLEEDKAANDQEYQELLSQV